MKRKYTMLAVLGVVAVLVMAIFFGLVPRPSSNSGSWILGSTEKGKPTIVVTYSILGSIVKELVGDNATVIVSIPAGVSPCEGFDPSARDIEALNKADLIVQNGLDLEGGMEKALAEAQSNGVKFFTASDYITVRHVGPGQGIPSDDPDQAVGAADPHLWMDPLDMKSAVAGLAVVLQQDLGMNVSSRAQDLENQLDSLNTEIANEVASIPPEDRCLVTGHESLGYFAQRYGFKLVGAIIPGLSSQGEVSAADMKALEAQIEENNVKAIFTELGTSPAVAKEIGDDTGVKVVELTTHILPSDGSYFTLMRNVAGNITDALK
ncbi:MAG TPA: metal ABC transporter substrate-binding protein [Dehalococcoidia bacterium]|nr:metal ABC transporter substrate-binding protein [Dehalococcoidia bacterium]